LATRYHQVKVGDEIYVKNARRKERREEKAAEITQRKAAC